MIDEFEPHSKEFENFLQNFKELNQIKEGSKILKKLEKDISVTTDEPTKRKYNNQFFHYKQKFVSELENLKAAKLINKLEFTENDASSNNLVGVNMNSNSLFNELNSRRANRISQKEEEVETPKEAPIAIEIVKSSRELDLTGTNKKQKIAKILTYVFLITVALFVLSGIIFLIIKSFQ